MYARSLAKGQATAMPETPNEVLDLLARSRAEQGLPPEVEDDSTIEHLAVLLRASAQGAANG
jgi:hypothetical protein